MIIRNYTYTSYNGGVYELSVDKNSFVLYHRGSPCPDPDFKKVENADEVYKKVIADKREITNAFSVVSYATYKGYKFQIDKTDGEMIKLSTGDHNAFQILKLDFVDRGWYETWVKISDIEKAWEERRPAGIDLPYPEGVEVITPIIFE